MHPKNSNILFPEIAKRLNCSEELVSDYIYFVFGELRKEMTYIRQINYCLPYIGRFDTTVPLLKKEIERFKKYKEEKGRFIGDVQEEIILNSAREKAMNESIRYRDIKLQKLKWHKENGDPYKKYNKEQEENLRRDQELLLQKQIDRKNSKKKNEKM